MSNLQPARQHHGVLAILEGPNALVRKEFGVFGGCRPAASALAFALENIMLRRFFIALALTALTTVGALAEETSMKVVIDILVKPEITGTAEGSKFSYPPSPSMQRIVWEPWSKFHYRIRETHVVTGDDASNLVSFVRAQISDKSPTWRAPQKLSQML